MTATGERVGARAPIPTIQGEVGSKEGSPPCRTHSWHTKPSAVAGAVESMQEACHSLGQRVSREASTKLWQRKATLALAEKAADFLPLGTVMVVMANFLHP